MLRSRQLSSAELTDACLRRITERNGGEPTFDGAPDAINAWVGVYPNAARDHAHAADRRLALDGESAPALCGIPLALKDLYGVAGLPLTASSRVLDGNVAAETRSVAAVAGPGHGAARPYAHARVRGRRHDRSGRQPMGARTVAGGSSGGSRRGGGGAHGPAAVGSDTCGSLRIPVCCCGTSTIKPTHGLSRSTASSRSRRRLTTRGRWRARSQTARRCSRRWRAGGADRPLMPPPAPIGELP